MSSSEEIEIKPIENEKGVQSDVENTENAAEDGRRRSVLKKTIRIELGTDQDDEQLPENEQKAQSSVTVENAEIVEKKFVKQDKSSFSFLFILYTVNFANISLVILKAVTAYISSSFSIGTSAIESFGDVFVSVLMLFQVIMDAKVNKTDYPRGKISTAVTNLTASIVMMTLASVNFIQSIDALITGQIDPDFSNTHIAVVVINIILKFLLFLLCLTKKEINQINVLMRDQLTDVKTNTIALVAVCLAKYFLKIIDFVGSLIIFLIIIFNWAPIVNDSWYRLQGIQGDEEINSEVRKLLLTNYNKFQELSGFLTYHVGEEFIVEIFCEPESSEAKNYMIAQIESISNCHKCYFLSAEEAKSSRAQNLSKRWTLSTNDETVSFLQPPSALE